MKNSQEVPSEDDKLEVIDLETATARNRQSLPRSVKRAMTVAIAISCLVFISILLPTLLPSMHQQARTPVPTQVPTATPTPAKPNVLPYVLVQGHILFINLLPLSPSYTSPVQRFVKAFNLDTGTVLWQYQAEQGINRITSDEQNGLILAQDASGTLAAIASDTGKVLWRFKNASPDDYPTAIQHVILLESQERVLALRASDGSLLWQLATVSSHIPSIDGTKLYLYDNSTNATVTVLDTYTGRVLSRYPITGSWIGEQQDILYLTENASDIFAIRLSDGKRLWTYHSQDVSARSMELGKELLYLFSYDGEVKAIKLSTGQDAWSKHVASGSQAVVLEDPTMIITGFSFGGSSVDVLRASDGKTLWHVAVPVLTMEACSATNLCVVTNDNTTSLVESATGHIYWHIQAQGRWFGFDTESAYQVGKNGIITAFRLKDGQQQWSAKAGSQVINARIYAHIFVASLIDGGIEALHVEDGKIAWRWKPDETNA